MSRAENVFAIWIEFKGAQEIKSFSENYALCNLIRQIADTIVVKGTIFVDLIPRTLPRCMCKWFNMDVLAVPIKALFGQICVTGHRYKTRTMNSRSINLLDKDDNIWWQLVPFFNVNFYLDSNHLNMKHLLALTIEIYQVTNNFHGCSSAALSLHINLF